MSPGIRTRLVPSMTTRGRWLALGAMIVLMSAIVIAAKLPGAIFTTTPDGSIVNENVHYTQKIEVYLDGGPPPNAPKTAAGLPDGLYVFQVTNPSGSTLLSQDRAACRVVRIAGGVIVAQVDVDGSGTPTGEHTPDLPANDSCHFNDNPGSASTFGEGEFAGVSARHDINADVDHGVPYETPGTDALVVQLMPFLDTPNPGGVYKAWLMPIQRYVANGGNLTADPVRICVRKNGNEDRNCSPNSTLVGHRPDPGFGPPRDEIKTDNFKVKEFFPPEIRVRKFHDSDGDGIKDEGEKEIGVEEFVNCGGVAICGPGEGGGGWPVDVTEPVEPGTVDNTLYTPFGVVVGAGTPGNYKFCEQTLTGWTQTAAYVDTNPSAGDNLNTPCVTVTVGGNSGETHEVWFGNAVRPTVETVIHNADHEAILTATVGMTVHDLATVSGQAGFPTPTGTVDFTFYYNAACDASGEPAGSDVPLVGGIAHPSDFRGPLAAGSYGFRAHYNGDEVFTSGDGPCEPLAVPKFAQGIATVIHVEPNETELPNPGFVAAGASVHDQVHLLGAGPFPIVPTTNAQFVFYSNGTCDGSGSSSYQSWESPSGVAHPSASYGPLAAGVYSFMAFLASDTNFDGAESPCEVLNVVDARISLSPLYAENPIHTEHTITATVEQNDGAGWDPAPNGTLVTFSLLNDSASTTFVGGVNTCTTAAGVCSIKITSPASGSVDIHAETTFSVSGVSLTRATGTAANTAAGGTGDARKVWVNPATRTLGFWATHTGFANGVWNAMPPAARQLCTADEITATSGPGTNQLMGGFWAGISTKSTGVNRSARDQARMQLLQQYLAAVLNYAYFNPSLLTDIETNHLLAPARAAYCAGGNGPAVIQAILTQAGLLDAFNNSGDNLGDTSAAGNATPDQSKLQAFIAFWDTTYR